jgi:hypothetical protein
MMMMMMGGIVGARGIVLRLSNWRKVYKVVSSL